MEDNGLRRAGLDYHEWATVKIHPYLDACLASLSPDTRIFALSTKGSVRYNTISFHRGDTLLFGPESRGLPQEVRSRFTCLSIPMQPHSRSLNLSNSVAVVLFEALRQTDFF